MTTIQKNGYVFLADREKTQQYYRTHTLCDCVYCRNYYAQVRQQFPRLDAFLSEFGVDIARPDEIMSVELEGHVAYLNVDYTVCGRVQTMGEGEIELYDGRLLHIAVTEGFASPNEQTGDYFTISVTELELTKQKWETLPKEVSPLGFVIGRC